ncbi:MAG: serine hydrolase, partial [Asgard group archaeon]|nr:serine hydrolase [Asgard group archaeon]
MDKSKSTKMDFTNFSKYAKELLETMNNAGLAISVFTSDEVLFEKGIGFRDISKKLPFTSETLFPIASHTKTFTSTAIAMLVEDGLLDWDIPIRSYYPKFKLKDSMASEKATIRDVLSHTTGLPNHQFIVMNSDWSYKKIIDRLPYLESVFDFRSKFFYCNLHYLFASFLIEELTGKSYFSFVSERILKPLGMKNTNFSIETTNKSDNTATGYSFSNDGFKEEPYPELKEIAAGAGSINSCLGDMHKWIQFHLNKGKVNGKQLFSEKTMQELYAILTLNPNDLYKQIIPDKNYVPFSGYALGWSAIFYRGGIIFQNYGAGFGCVLNAGFLPQQDIGFVIFSNTSGSTIPACLNVYIADQALGLKVVNWGIKMKEFEVKMKKLMERNYQEAMKKQKKNSKLSHPLEDYVGIFHHPGYGKLEFSLQNNQLKASYGKGSEHKMDHYHYDTFSMTIDRFKETKFITFRTNA